MHTDIGHVHSFRLIRRDICSITVVVQSRPFSTARVSTLKIAPSIATRTIMPIVLGPLLPISTPELGPAGIPLEPRHHIGFTRSECPSTHSILR